MVSVATDGSDHVPETDYTRYLVFLHCIMKALCKKVLDIKYVVDPVAKGVKRSKITRARSLNHRQFITLL